MAAEAAARSAWPRGRGMGLGSGLGGGGATGAIGSLVVGWDKDSLSGGGLDRGKADSSRRVRSGPPPGPGSGRHHLGARIIG